MQLREAVELPEGHREHFRAETRAAHAQKQNMREPLSLHFFDEFGEALAVRQLIFGDAQPAEPLALIGARPQGGVARPKPSHFSVDAPVLEHRGDFGVKVGAQRVGRAANSDAGREAAAAVDRVQELVERLGKKSHPLGDQLVGDFVERDAETLERG